MKNFFRVLIIIFLFVVCLLLGANLANITLPETTQSSTTQLTDNTQNQMLIFVVDDFDNRKPQLQSVWSVILYWHDNSGMMVLPLSDPSNPNFDEFKKSFLLTNEKELNERSSKYFNSKFKTKFDNFIVLDQLALQQLLTWISNGSIVELSANIIDSTSTIKTLCAYLSSDKPSLNGFDWGTIFSSHFKSNLSAEQMNSIWNNSINSDLFQCEVILD